jgi:hypothetical protein
MMLGRADDILSRIMSEGLAVWDETRLSAVLNSQTPPLDRTERLALLKGLLQRYAFQWTNYVCAELEDLATIDEVYVDVLLEAITKLDGMVFRTLTNIGVKRPQLGIELSAEMQRRGESWALPSGCMLGGVARADFTRAKPVLDGLSSSSDELNQAKALRAYREIYNPYEAAVTAVPPEISRFAREAALSANPALLEEGVGALFDFAKFDEPRAGRAILLTAKRNKPAHKVITRYTHAKDRLGDANTAKLLKVIVKSEDDNILRDVVSVLATRGMNFQDEALEMLLSLVTRDKYHRLYMLDYAAEQIGNADVNKAVIAVEKALAKRRRRKLISAADGLLADLCKSDYVTLARHLAKWLHKDGLRQRIAFRTAREILGSAFEARNEEVADVLRPPLEWHAKKKGVNVQAIIHHERDKNAQCIEIISEIERSIPRLDYSKMERAWRKFPSLNKFLGDSWFKEKKRERDRHHDIIVNLALVSQDWKMKKYVARQPKNQTPLQAFLRSLRIRDALRPQAFLSYLDEMAATVQGMPNTRSLKQGLRSEDHFQETMSELQLIHVFARAGHQIAIKPPVGTKNLDLEAVVDGTAVLFEVVNPELFRKLKYSSSAQFIPNRARKLVINEFEKHLAQLPRGEKRPIVIVIDSGRSEIDDDFIDEVIHGDFQFTWWTDKRTGQVVAEGTTRAKDSLHEQAARSGENYDMISAVVSYKTRFTADGVRFGIAGSILVNPAACNPLNGSQVSAIQQALFGKDSVSYM